MERLEANLNAIRSIIDVNLVGVEMSSVLEHGKRLSALMGLSSECMAAAQKKVHFARLAAIQRLSDKNYPPRVLLKVADAEIGVELATYEYADRLNASLTHQLDYIRTLVSLHKTELENSLHQ